MMPGPLALAARLLFAPTLVVAAALLVKGHDETGGGFAAGMVASLGTLLQHVALGREETRARHAWTLRARALALLGLALMAATALLPALAGRPPVWHLPRPGEAVATFGPLALQTALLFEVGVALATYGFVVAAIHAFDRVREEDGA